MYAAVQRYQAEASAVGEGSERIHDGLVPVVRRAPGFVAYYVVNAGDGIVVAVSVFQDRDRAEAASRMAADRAERNLSGALGEPIVTTGDVVVYEGG